MYTAVWTLRAYASGCLGHMRVCIRPCGHFGRTRVCTTTRTFSDVRACDGRVDVSDVRACARLRGRFRWTHMRTAHKLNFMDDWVIFDRIIQLHATKSQGHATKSKRHATKNGGMQLKVDGK